MIAGIENSAHTNTSDAKPQILFIDAFDSFSNNITGLLEQCLNAHVTLVHIDDEHVDRHFETFVRNFDAVVVGPGPGHPAVARDVGFIDKLWRLDEQSLLPVLGICLGFQSLCLAFGAEVTRLKLARHGIVTRVSHRGSDVWRGIENCDATQYHSLQVVIGPNYHPGQVGDDEIWKVSDACPSLLPLAWDLGDEVNGPILSSARHITKPFWGVQFHPESICTSGAGRQLVENWWSSARDWSYRRAQLSSFEKSAHGFNSDGPHSMLDSRLTPLPLQCTHASLISGRRPSPNHSSNRPRGRSDGQGAPRLNMLPRSGGTYLGGKQEPPILSWANHPVRNVTPIDLLEALGHNKSEVILLDSQAHAMSRYSIIGLILPDITTKVTYKVGDRVLRYGTHSDSMSSLPVDSIEDVWPILQEALDFHNPQHRRQSPRHSSPDSGSSASEADLPDPDILPNDSPFWGGFMGYISYEAGLETIDVDLHSSCDSSNMPDVNFAFIQRSLVFDHKIGQLYVQSLLPTDSKWIQSVGEIIRDLTLPLVSPPHNPTIPCMRLLKEQASLETKLATASVSRPSEQEYRHNVLRCQDFLRSGDSYELCLTNETEIKLQNESANIDEWLLYKRLRSRNPAPFGAFVRFPDVTILGSSPERFLSWTRSGRCQFRPIKGTVKKSDSMTRERAHEILGSSKERAENLMIVDLIRHDLSGIVGAANTWVSKLMVVEEYQTVYQLVSVVEGQLPAPSSPATALRGLDVLKASLPPGSMTGAPKKRSCEILRDIERRPRGVYSGVLGYMDVGGAGDFSVVIRTLVRARGQDRTSTGDGRNQKHCSALHLRGNTSARTEKTWRLGAGGAVTIQSTDEAEFQEMETKASSVLGALFG